jgi:hypothetical protein
VYFGVGSTDIGQIVEEPTRKRHQGNVLDARIRDALSNHWDVRQALYYRKLKLRGEATASATWKDARPGEPRQQEPGALAETPGCDREQGEQGSLRTVLPRQGEAIRAGHER